MCGLFGFVGGLSDSDAFERIAMRASERGPHAHGWTAVYPDGIITERYLRPLGENLDQFRRALDRGPRAFVGHARLSTVGGDSHERIEDAQPINVEPVSVAHNGSADFGVHNPEIASGNDSERIARLMANYLDKGLEAGRALHATMEMMLPRVSYAVLALYRGEVVLACRRGRVPLYRRDGFGTTILSSTAFPGSSFVADRGVVEIRIPYDSSWGQCSF